MISRKILIAVAVGLLFLAGGASAVLESFGTVSGTADVERPLEIKEIYYESNISYESSGEYVLLELNTGVDFSDWNLSSVGEDVDFNNISQVVKSDFALLVENESVVRETPEDTRVFDIGTIDESGLSDDPGEKINLSYIPQSVQIQIVDYTNSGCENHEAYRPEEGCKNALVDISGDSE